MNEETITIPLKEYEELINNTIFLEALRAAGVDNWQGYDVACKSTEE